MKNDVCVCFDLRVCIFLWVVTLMFSHPQPTTIWLPLLPFPVSALSRMLMASFPMNSVFISVFIFLALVNSNAYLCPNIPS